MSICKKGNGTKPFVIFTATSWITRWGLSSSGDYDHIHAAQTSPGTTVGPINTTCGTSSDGISQAAPHPVADDGVLDAAVALLLADTVLVVLASQHLTAGKVVALNSA